MQQFNSLTALIDHVETLPWREDGDARNPEDGVSKAKFYGGSSPAEEIRLARFGWPEATGKAAAMAGRIADRIVGRSSIGMIDTVGYDVTGASFDAGAVALGIPEAWGVLEPQESKRAVRIVLNCSVSQGVDVEVIRARGVAVSSLVMVLQAKGYPVTVEVFSASSTTEDCLTRIADASTGSQLDLDRVIFALTHPAMYRRLTRAAESGYFNGKGGDKWGHGIPESDKQPPGEIDLFIGGVHYSEAERWLKGGEDWVLAEYLKQTG